MMEQLDQERAERAKRSIGTAFEILYQPRKIVPTVDEAKKDANRKRVNANVKRFREKTKTAAMRDNKQNARWTI